MANRLVLYHGVIDRYILEKAVVLVEKTAAGVLAAAVAMVPKGPTGVLAASLHATIPSAEGLKVTGQVGSDVSYAQVVHDGMSAHFEKPGTGEKILYLGPEGFATYVHHPGTQGVKYLTDPLERVGRHAGFIVHIGH